MMQAPKTIKRMLALGACFAVVQVGLGIAWVSYSVVHAKQAWEEGGMGRMSSIVREQALRFRLLHPMASGVYPGESLEGVFAHSFLGGFTCGSRCGIMNAPQVETQAYMAGVLLRTAHPEDADVVMAGYGFRRIEVDGVWTRAQEMSAFSPKSDSEQHWWLSFFESPESAWQTQFPGQPISSNGNGEDQIHVLGYLSPEGRFGQLAGYTRQLLVVKIGYAPQ